MRLDAHTLLPKLRVAESPGDSIGQDGTFIISEALGSHLIDVAGHECESRSPTLVSAIGSWVMSRKACVMDDNFLCRRYLSSSFFM